jgi:hypothetical protein
VCLLAGAVALFLKVFSLGGLYPGPIIGIGAEALIVEIALTATGSRRAGAVLAGACAMALPPVQMTVGLWVVGGRELIGSYAHVVRSVAPGLTPELVLAVVVSAASLVGAMAGLWCWTVAGRVLRRVGRRP